jgi:CRISPR-associated protein Csm3
MYLDKYEEITGVIHCLSGVRIGGNSNVIEIGTIDNPIIRNPLTNHPYLPGSSLKGKMRSCLELSLRAGAQPKISLGLPQLKPTTDREGKKEIAPCACGKCVVCKLFGSGNNKTNYEPTRLLFRDCLLTDKSTETLEAAARTSGVFFAEIKPGIRMNRATNSVAQRAFFNFERVPEGIEFNFELVVRLYGDLDSEEARKDYRKIVARGLQLLEKEGIGGKISAGYGKIQFRDLQWDGQPFNHNQSFDPKKSEG